MICLSRLGWIASCLRYAGCFGPKEKKALMHAFEVSGATISRDQMKLWRLWPDNGSVALEKGKLVVRDQADLEFPAGISMPPLHDWLEVMMKDKCAQVEGAVDMEPKDTTIRAFVQGIREHKVLSILYLSRSAPELPKWRYVSPHALVRVAGRYHAHCWDDHRQKECDFVLTRVRAVIVDKAGSPAYSAPAPNGPWIMKTQLEVRLAKGQPLSLARGDYGLNELGQGKLRLRKALVPYVVSDRQLGFEDLVEIREPKNSNQ